MKPKHIFNTILAVLFVFPLIGTFAQQAPNSGSIEVITTFDYPGTGNSTIPQKPPVKEAGTEMKPNDSQSLVTPLNQSPSARGGAMPR